MSMRKFLFLFQGKGHECDYCGMLYNRTALKQHMEKHKKKGHLQVFKTFVICSVSWHIFRHFGFLDQRWANLFGSRATLRSSASCTLPRPVLDQRFSTQIVPRPVFLKKKIHDPQMRTFVSCRPLSQS